MQFVAKVAPVWVDVKLFETSLELKPNEMLFATTQHCQIKCLAPKPLTIHFVECIFRNITNLCKYEKLLATAQ